MFANSFFHLLLVNSNINSFADTQCAMCSVFTKQNTGMNECAVFSVAILNLTDIMFMNVPVFIWQRSKCVALPSSKTGSNSTICCASFIRLVFSFHSMLSALLTQCFYALASIQSTLTYTFLTYSVYQIEFHRFSVNAILEWTIPFFSMIFADQIKSKEEDDEKTMNKRREQKKTVIKSLVIFHFI